MENFCSQAYTANGSVSLNRHNNPEDGIFTYVLKGYPDCLKRQLINTVDTCAECETEYDSEGNPFSLVNWSKGFRITDGTYPDSAEPKTYGLIDGIVDLGAYQNFSVLQSRKEAALNLMNEIKKTEKRCTEFISAAGGIEKDCAGIEDSALRKPALNRYAAKLWKKYGSPPTGKVGREKKYFADVISPSGMSFPFEKFSGLCRNISVINDFSSAVSAPLVDKIRLYALSCGFDVISFISVTDTSSVCHIAVPDIGYGIYCEKTEHAQFDKAEYIRKNRFLDSEYTGRFRSRTMFCRKAYSELLDGASASLAELQKLRKSLDDIYLSATDSEKFISDIALKIAGIDKISQKVYN